MDVSSLIHDALINNLPDEARRLKPVVIGDLQESLVRIINNVHHIDTIRPGRDGAACYYIQDDLRDIENISKTIPRNSYLIILGTNSSLGSAMRSYIFLRDDSRRYQTFNLNTLLLEPLGKLSFIRPLPDSLNRYVRILGSKVPNSRFSPYYIAIFHKYTDKPFARYVSRMSLAHRVNRITERYVYKFQNSRLNDTLNGVKRTWRTIVPTSQKRYQIVATNHLQHAIHKEVGKIHLAIATGQLASGGVERVLLNILKELPRENYHITIYSTTWSSNTWSDEFEKYSDQVIHIPQVFGHAYPIKYHRQFLIEHLHRIQPDIFLITNSALGYEALPDCAEIGMHAIDLLHTYGTPKEKGAFLRTSLPFDKHLQKRIVISNYLRDYFIKHYPIDPKKINVIYNGVPPLETTELNDHILQDMGISPQSSVITYIGRLQADKSPQRLVEIAHQSQSLLAKAKTKILVVGDGQLRQKLETYANQLGVLDKTIKFVGYHADPLSIAKCSRFTILTSDLEGVPMSILESMQVGTPPISTSVGGVPEIFDDTCGLLAPLGHNHTETITNLSHAIERGLAMSENEYRSMQVACKRRIDLQFSSMPQQYHNLFMTLVK